MAKKKGRSIGLEDMNRIIAEVQARIDKAEAGGSRKTLYSDRCALLRHRETMLRAFWDEIAGEAEPRAARPNHRQ